MWPTIRLWLRRTRRPTLIWLVATSSALVVVVLAYKAEVRSSADAARFAAAAQALARMFEPLLGRAEALDTLGGFATWRVLGVMAVLLSVFAVLTTSRLTVGEERRGAADIVLSTPLARRRFLTAQALVVAAECFLVALVALLVAWLVGRGAGLHLAGAWWAGVGLALTAAFWGGASALLAQLVHSRAATGAVTGMLLVTSYLMTNLAVSHQAFTLPARLSPFGALDVSRPLVPGRSVDLSALALLAAAALALWVLSVAAFTRRDLNAAGSRRWVSSLRIDATGLLRGPVLRDAWSLRGIAAAWGLGLSVYMVIFTLTDRGLRGPIEDIIRQAGPLAEVAGRAFLGDEPIGMLIFSGFAGPILGVFAALQVGRWAGDLEGDHLALALATSVGRTRLLLSRVAAVLLAGVVALLITWVATLVSAKVASVRVEPGRLFVGMVAPVVLLLVFLGFGLAVAGWWRPAWAAALTGILVVANLLFDLVSPLFGLPSWTGELSLLTRAGNPFREGLTWGHQGVLVAVAVLLVGLAAWGFERRDLPS